MYFTLSDSAFFPPNFWITLSLCFMGSQCQNVGKFPADSVVVMSGFPHIFDHCAWSKLRALDGTAIHNLAWVGACYVIPGSARPKHLMPSTVSPRLTMKWLSCQMQLLKETEINNIRWCKYWILKVSTHHHVSGKPRTVLQFTKHCWSFTVKQRCSFLLIDWSRWRLV